MLYFIVNKTSSIGKSSQIWEKVLYYLNNNSIEYKSFYTGNVGHARIISNYLSKLNKERIHLVVVGGDGTINEVINGVTDFSKVVISVIPAGSGNDFANGLGISSDIEENMYNILHNEIETHDLVIVKYGDSNSRLFCISSGVGLDALVCKKVNNSIIKKILNAVKLGKLSYIILTIISLLSLDTVKSKIKIDNKEEREYSRLIFSAAMNMCSEGGGVPMAPNSKSNDGKMTICSAHNLSKYITFFVLPILVLAKHEKLKCFDIFDCKNLKIITKKPVALHADGEYLGDFNKIQIMCKKSLLRIIK